MNRYVSAVLLCVQLGSVTEIYINDGATDARNYNLDVQRYYFHIGIKRASKSESREAK